MQENTRLLLQWESLLVVRTELDHSDFLTLCDCIPEAEVDGMLPRDEESGLLQNLNVFELNPVTCLAASKRQAASLEGGLLSAAKLVCFPPRCSDS